MDEIDLRIIEELDKNARISNKELADMVFLSAPAVKARIEKLCDEGVIEGFHASINASKLGYMIKAYINIEMNPTLKPKFYKYIKSVPNVIECDCVTGNYSMLIKVLFKTTEELDTFIGKIQEYGKTYTQIVFSTSVKHRNVNK